jgi:hypothetical protein
MLDKEWQMTSRIAKALAGALSFGLAGWASASIPAIDLFDTPGVPGTGGSTIIQGPCYCDQPAWYSPVLLLQPGTYDFGELRQYWVQSDGTPDGGPDQANLYLLFDPIEVSGHYPEDFAALPTYTFPAYALCAQEDAACNALYVGAYRDFDLTFSVPPGDDAVQVGLIGHYLYTSPVPEPAEAALFALGLALVARAAKARARA